MQVLLKHLHADIIGKEKMVKNTVSIKILYILIHVIIYLASGPLNDNSRQ